MLVDKIELYLVENAFFTPWRTAYGSDPGNCAVFARMVSGTYEGWSESSPLCGPNYSYEHGAGAYEVAKRFLAPCIVGKDFITAKELNDAMAHIKGNPFAKAAIEMAWWNLDAAIKGKTLGDMLGTERKEVPLGDGFGVSDSYDALIAKIGESFDKGYSRVKLKVMHGWDVEMLEAVRSVFPTQTFHIDCNASYTFAEADVFKKIDKFHLAMIEQPFQSGDIYNHAKLQKMIDTPICLDETITEPWQAEVAAELGACGYVNIKPARVGGLQNSLDINTICAQAGIGCWVGGMMESDVGKSICTEWAVILNMVYPHDITPSVFNYPDIITSSVLEETPRCTIACSDRIGTPVVPDIEKFLKKVITSAVITGARD